jgi:hypothetical protein
MDDECHPLMVLLLFVCCNFSVQNVELDGRLALEIGGSLSPPNGRARRALLNSLIGIIDITLPSCWHIAYSKKKQ